MNSYMIHTIMECVNHVNFYKSYVTPLVYCMQIFTLIKMSFVSQLEYEISFQKSYKIKST